MYRSAFRATSLFAALVLVTVTRADMISFEQTPASQLPGDNWALTSPFNLNSGTVRFFYDADGDNAYNPAVDANPVFEQTGDDNTTGFVNDTLAANDIPASDYKMQIGDFFLRKPWVNNGWAVGPLMIDFAVTQPIVAISGEIWDIDGTPARPEQWQVDVLDAADAVLATVTSPLGDGNALDGMPWLFSFANLPAGVAKVRVGYIGTRLGNVGPCFNNLRVLFAPPPGKPPSGVPLPAGPVSVDPAFDKQVTYARTLHVATTGSDSTGDGSSAQPYASLQKALQGATPGTKIIVHAGIYFGRTSVSDVRGTQLQPILVTTAPGEPPPVLDAGAPGSAMHLSDPNWLVLENLVLSGSTGDSLNIDDGGAGTDLAHHVILRSLTIVPGRPTLGATAIRLCGVNDAYVLGCQMADAMVGIDLVGCRQSVIAYNRIQDCINYGITARAGSEDVLILGNLLVRAGERAIQMGGWSSTGVFRPQGSSFVARNIRAIANVIKYTTAAFAFTNAVDSLAMNNTVYMPGRYVARILNENPSLLWPQNGRVCNNIIYLKRLLMGYVSPLNIGPDTMPETFGFVSNLWYCVDDAAFAGYNLAPVPAETDPIYQQDPLFARLADAVGTHRLDDFHLQRASPALGQGVSFASFGLSQPGDRDAHAYLDPPTLGAYEIGRPGDINGDTYVNVGDLQVLVAKWATTLQDLGYDPHADLNSDGYTNVGDLQLLVANWGQ